MAWFDSLYPPMFGPPTPIINREFMPYPTMPRGVPVPMSFAGLPSPQSAAAPNDPYTHGPAVTASIDGPKSWIGRNLGISTNNENADMAARERAIANQYKQFSPAVDVSRDEFSQGFRMPYKGEFDRVGTNWAFGPSADVERPDYKGDPLTISVNKPNVTPGQPPAPPSNPAPLMGNAPDMALWNATATSAPPTTPGAERKPFDWGADSALWSPMMAAGAAMMQPSWYGLGGQLGQGLTAASEAARKAPTERLQRRLMEAQVGKAEADSAARSSLTEFARRANLPAGVMLALQLNPEKAGDILEKYDPAMKEAYLKFEEEKSGSKAKGSFPYDVAKAAAGATNIAIKTEAQASAIEGLWKKYTDAAKAATNPADKARLQATADAFYRQMTVGEKDYPEKLRQQAVELGTGTTAAANLATLLNNPDISRLNFNDRAAIAQQFQNLNLAYATLKNRGANFTDSEQKMIAALAGGDPNAWGNMALRTRQDFIKKLEIAHREMVAEWDRIQRAYARGEPTMTPFPQFNAPANRSTARGANDPLGIR